MDLKSDVIIDISYDSIKTDEGEQVIIDGIRKSRVSWNLDIEARDWGIKTIIFYCPDQKIEFEIELESESGDSTYATLEVSIKDIDTNDVDKISDLYLDSLEIKLNKIEQVSKDRYKAEATGYANFGSAC